MSQINILPSCDYLFKVILVGEEEPLKTGLLWAFTGYNDMISDYKKTIGVNFGITSVHQSDTIVKLQIWDISFEPRIKYLRPNYFKGASGCIMVVRDLNQAKNYLNELKTFYNRQIPVFFIYITDEPVVSQFYESLDQLSIHLVDSGSAGLEWLAETMLSYRRRNIDNYSAALFVINGNQVQETIQALSQTRIQAETERLENERKQRLEQLTFITEALQEMEIPVTHEVVKIISLEALFEVNILTGDIDLFPLKCDLCSKDTRNCQRKHGKLCIIKLKDSLGWSSNDLDSKSLLIISKIYAILNEQLPAHVKNQIRNITQCMNYHPKKEGISAAN